MEINRTMTLTNLGSWNYIAPPKYTIFDRFMSGIFIIIMCLVAGYLIAAFHEILIGLGLLCLAFFSVICLGSWVLDR
jgi:hypothetical protein